MRTKRRKQWPRIDWRAAKIIEVKRTRCDECGAILPPCQRSEPTGDGAQQRQVVCDCGAPYILIVE